MRFADLYVTRGARLLRSGSLAAIHGADGEPQTLPANAAGSVLWLNPGVTLSSESLVAACRSGWELLLVDGRGRLAARATAIDGSPSGLVRRSQLLARESAAGPTIAAALVITTIRNQRHLLRSLGGARYGTGLTRYLERLAADASTDCGSLQASRRQLLLMEARAARQYYRDLGALVGSPQLFAGRRLRRPPGDIGNAVLSYGYAIVYGKVLAAIHAAGLDPYLGFLHADRAGRPSLVYDLAEIFKQPLVDRVLFGLRGERLSGVAVDGGCWLDAPTRRIVLARLDERLRAPVDVGGGMSWSDLFLFEARRLAAFVAGRRSAYRPHVHDWH